MLSVGTKVELTLIRMLSDGYALAYHDGETIMVRGGYPGESVVAELTQRKKRVWFATTVEVLAPHSARIKPPCPHFADCGGCLWMDISYEEQLRMKEAILLDAFRHIGGFDTDSLPIERIISSPKIFRHRQKMEFSFVETDGEMSIGLHRRGSWRERVPTPACYLINEDGLRFGKNLSDALFSAGVSIHNDTTHRGELRYLTLRFNSRGEFIAFVTLFTANQRDVVHNAILEVGKKFPNLVSAGTMLNQKSGAAAAGEISLAIGDGYLDEHIGDVVFRISPLSFFQTNIFGVLILSSIVAEVAGRGDELWDLYCGTGTLSLPLAGHFDIVRGVEVVPEAVADALANARFNGISNSNYCAGKVRASLKDMLAAGLHPDVILLDPPRAGVGKKALTRVVESSASRIVYVSCNPATLARDIAILSENYSVERIIPLDMFPHTPHIETIVGLAHY